MSDFRTQNPFCRPVCSLSLEVNTAFYSVVRGVVWWCFSVKAIPGNFCFFSSPYLQTAESEFVLTITTEFIKKLWLTNFVSSHHLFWFTSDRFQKLVYPHVNKAALFGLNFLILNMQQLCTSYLIAREILNIYSLEFCLGTLLHLDSVKSFCWSGLPGPCSCMRSAGRNSWV